jgi:hypothetical protein
MKELAHDENLDSADYAFEPSVLTIRSSFKDHHNTQAFNTRHKNETIEKNSPEDVQSIERNQSSNVFAPFHSNSRVMSKVKRGKNAYLSK